MKSLWRQSQAARFTQRYRQAWGEDIALLTYATRLVGSVPELAMHGGGNTSCKGRHRSAAGEDVPALFIKPSGADMGKVVPADFIVMDFGYLKTLSSLSDAGDTETAGLFRRHMLSHSVFSPSIETPMHAFVEKKFVVHTHPSAILALSNRADGQKTVADALGPAVGFVPYQSLGLHLGRAVAAEMAAKNDPPAIVLSQHGLVVWGDSAREAYEKTIGYVTRAEDYLRKKAVPMFPASGRTSLHTASRRFQRCLPIMRELFAAAFGGKGRKNAGKEPFFSHLVSEKLLARLGDSHAADIFCAPPLNPDHLLRIKLRPVFLENPDYDDPDALRALLAKGIETYRVDYGAYIARHADRLQGLLPRDEEFFPRAFLFPGMGAVTTAHDRKTADIYRDILRQAIDVKSAVHETGGEYQGLSEDDAFEMELRMWRKAASTAPA